METPQLWNAPSFTRGCILNDLKAFTSLISREPVMFFFSFFLLYNQKMFPVLSSTYAKVELMAGIQQPNMAYEFAWL